MVAFSLEDIVIDDNLHKTYGKNVIAVDTFHLRLRKERFSVSWAQMGLAKAQPLKFSQHCWKKPLEKPQSTD